MIKNKHYSVYSDFKTGILYKIFISVGIIFITIFISLKITSKIPFENIGFLNYFYNISTSQFPEIILSISILLLSFGLILYFLNLQFLKLSKIANEIENKEKNRNKK